MGVKVTKVKGQGRRSRSKCNISIFNILSKVKVASVKVKGCKGQDQRSWVKVTVSRSMFLWVLSTPMDSQEVCHGTQYICLFTKTSYSMHVNTLLCSQDN